MRAFQHLDESGKPVDRSSTTVLRGKRRTDFKNYFSKSSSKMQAGCSAKLFVGLAQSEKPGNTTIDLV
jgi:hypothetical protein